MMCEGCGTYTRRRACSGCGRRMCARCAPLHWNSQDAWRREKCTAGRSVEQKQARIRVHHYVDSPHAAVDLQDILAALQYDQARLEYSYGKDTAVLYWNQRIYAVDGRSYKAFLRWYDESWDYQKNYSTTPAGDRLIEWQRRAKEPSWPRNNRSVGP